MAVLCENFVEISDRGFFVMTLFDFGNGLPDTCL